MDRSQMRMVQTNDKETRQAFKANLADKLNKEETKETITPSSVLEVGTTVWHPSLGEAVVVSLQDKEITLECSIGNVTFSLSQIRPFLSLEAPKPEPRIVEEAAFGDVIEKLYPNRPDVAFRTPVDQPIKGPEPVPEVTFVPEREPKRDEWQGAFFGEEIDRTPLHRPDQAFREPQNTGKIVSPDFQDVDKSEVTFVPEREPKTDKWQGAFFGEEIDRTKIVYPDVAYRPVVDQPIKDFEPVPEVEFVPEKEPKRDTWEGAFVGDEIDRTPPNRPDQAFRQPQNTGKMVSPDFETVQKPSFEIGDLVWHPQLGKCLVEALGKNQIILLAADGQKVDLVLSQVQSQLHALAGEAPEVVPVKPLVREQSRNLQTRNEIKKISVNLPNQFKDWTKQNQFHFLTNNQHLTTDDANRVFTAMGRPDDASVSISWFEPEPLPVPEVKEVVVYKTINGSELVGRKVWHPDFGECVVASVDNSEIVLNTKVGSIPFISHHILPILVPLADDTHVDHKIRYDLKHIKSD